MNGERTWIKEVSGYAAIEYISYSFAPHTAFARRYRHDGTKSWKWARSPEDARERLGRWGTIHVQDLASLPDASREDVELAATHLRETSCQNT